MTGDFNLHHPLWNPSNYRKQDPEADTLIDIISQTRLKLMLPAGTITFPRAKTAIDLVWGNNYIEQRIIKCRIAKNIKSKTIKMQVQKQFSIFFSYNIHH